MARIGDYINPAYGALDYRALMGVQERNASRVGQSVQQGVGAVTDAVSDRADFKKQLKVGQDQIKAAATLYGDDTGMLAQLGESLSDEEAPLSQRAAAAQNVSDMIGMQIRQQETDRQHLLEQRGMAVREGGLAIDQSMAGKQMELMDWELGAANDAAEDEETFKNIQAVALWNEYKKIDPEGAKALFDSGIDGVQMYDILAARMKKSAPELINADVTIDGQAGKIHGFADPDTGVFTPLQLPDDGSAPSAQDLKDAAAIQSGMGIGQPSNSALPPLPPGAPAPGVLPGKGMQMGSVAGTTEAESLDVALKRIKLQDAQMGLQEKIGKEKAGQEQKVKLLDIANQIPNHPGFNAAVGFGIRKFIQGFLPGDADTPIPGTDEAGVLAMIDELKGILTLDKMGLMTGVLSDKDIEMLTKASGRLGTAQTEDDFLKSLEEIKAALSGSGAALAPEAPKKTGAAGFNQRYNQR